MAVNFSALIDASKSLVECQGRVDALKARKQALQDQLAVVTKQLNDEQASSVTALASLKTLVNA